MEGDTFQQWKNQCLSKCDLSKKGSVDHDISHIVSFINSHDQYFTTSSCSGRMILIDGVSDCPDVQKQNCSWLFVTHQKCQNKDVVTGLEKSVGEATFKFEPFVLHVQCKHLEDAQLLHTVAINSGFRNSGITVGKKGKIIMAVRSTHCLEVPLSHRGKVLISDEYLDFLVGVANEKMEENLKRIERFNDCLQAALQPQQQIRSLQEGTDKKPVYRRRRKRVQVNSVTDCDSQSVKEPTESNQKEMDCDLMFLS
ncbi:tRNA wybutosine-synthesizing protein 3 homolog [Myxocyprinus asiaticus]|uniref:tRNA wybutosine-synthesizing protein 3 homolog n=1 Tax=Myxocyprinus asiaticus TaxID=70543 RepID=UPI0022228C38|nr:tRNA wybutosine-synthesizing protein 3 homolog [Myxocyprinus asiaticus]